MIYLVALVMFKKQYDQGAGVKKVKYGRSVSAEVTRRIKII